MTIEFACFLQGTFADPWIIPLIQGYVEVREVPLLTGQTSDVAQGRYHRHSEGRLKQRDSDVDLKVKAGGGEAGSGREMRAMIEMTEMTSKADADQDDDDEDLKGTCMCMPVC